MTRPRLARPASHTPPARLARLDARRLAWLCPLLLAACANDNGAWHVPWQAWADRPGATAPGAASSSPLAEQAVASVPGGSASSPASGGPVGTASGQGKFQAGTPAANPDNAPPPADWRDDEWLALARASMTLRVFDALKQGCMRQGGFKLEPAMAVHTWMQRNKIDETRPVLADLERQAQVGQQFDLGARNIVQRLRDKNPKGDCEAALTLIRLPQSELRPLMAALMPRSKPGVAAALAGTKPPVTPAAIPSTKAASGNPNAKSPPPKPQPRPPGQGSLPDELLAQIERFGFDARATLAGAGLLGADIYPVLLFKDGSALTQVTDLPEADSLDELRRLHPEHWLRWRRQDEQIQLQSQQAPAGVWQRLAFRNTFTGWPEGLKLDASFTLQLGAPDASSASTSGLTTWQALQFNADGALLRDRGPGSATQAGRRGRYRIEGFVLKAQFEDGSTARHLFITDPNDIRGPIWLDGVPYSRDKR